LENRLMSELKFLIVNFLVVIKAKVVYIQRKRL